MVEIVSLAQLREQVRLEQDDTTQDAVLSPALVAAIRAVENRTGARIEGEGRNLPDGDLPVARQAVLMLAAHWFKNRETSGDIPPAVEWLILPLSKLAI